MNTYYLELSDEKKPEHKEPQPHDPHKPHEPAEPEKKEPEEEPVHRLRVEDEERRRRLMSYSFGDILIEP